MTKEIPQSINLLTPVNTPEDAWERLYDWLFSIGKYLLIGVQIVVLSVLAARFMYDRKNNDLTQEVNSLSTTLADDFFRNSEIRYNNWHRLFNDMNIISDEQPINSTVVASVIESVPSDVQLLDISYISGRVSMNLTAGDFQAIQRYESLLKKNSKYDQQSLRVTLNKSGSEESNIDFSIAFNISEEAASNSAAQGGL